jgi:CBS domain-containing protein
MHHITIEMIAVHRPNDRSSQETFIELILAQQIDDVDHGIPPSNAITVKRLSSNSRSRLRNALEAVQHLEDLQRDLLFKA